MTISKGASAEAICPPTMITVKNREQTQVRIPRYLIDNLFRQRLPFKEALVNFASLMQPRGWRLLSRTTKQNTNVGDLDVAAPQSGDLASGSQWRVRSQWGLGEAGRHSAVHPATPVSFSRSSPPLFPNSGLRECSRKERRPTNSSLRFYTVDPPRNDTVFAN